MVSQALYRNISTLSFSEPLAKVSFIEGYITPKVAGWIMIRPLSPKILEVVNSQQVLILAGVVRRGKVSFSPQAPITNICEKCYNFSSSAIRLVMDTPLNATNL